MIRLLGTGILSVAFVIAAFAQRPWVQWQPENGVEVRTGANFIWTKSAASNLNNENQPETAVLWAETRGGVSSFYVQIIAANDGFVLPDGGLEVSRTVERKWFPQLTADLGGGWFAAWFCVTGEQFRERMVIKYTKFSREGDLLWQEGTIDAPAYTEWGREEPPVIVPDGDGGCIIFWLDDRNGGDVYALHIEANGSIDGNWQRNGVPVISGIGYQDQMRVTSDGSGGAFVVCRSHRQRNDGNILCQHINRDGDLLWGGFNGIAVCSDSADQELPEICSDGAGGAFVAWIDSRNNANALLCQRFDANGNLYWGDASGGEVIREEDVDDGLNATMKLLPAEDESAVVIWQDYREGGYQSNIYAQRIGGAQNRFSKYWREEQGMPVVEANGNQRPTDAKPDGSGGIYIVWSDGRNQGFPFEDIFVQRIDSDGDPRWANNGVRVAVGQNQPGPGKIELSAAGCSVFWMNYNSADCGLFAQKLLDRNGQSLWDAGGLPLVRSDVQGEAFLSDLVTQIDENNTFAVLWIDNRFGGQVNPKPMIQFYSHQESRSPIEAPGISNGLSLIELDSGYTNRVKGIPDGEGGAIAFWSGERNDRSRCYRAQKITSDGDRRWGERGIFLNSIDHNGGNPQLISDGDGGAILGLSGSINRTDVIFAHRINQEGELLWGENGIEFTGGGSNALFGLAEDNEGGAVFIWRERNDANRILKISRLNQEGSPAWEPEIRTISQVPCVVSEAKIVNHPEGWFVVWRESLGHDSLGIVPGIYGQFINRDGSFRWAETGLSICTVAGQHYEPVVTVDAERTIWVAWTSRERPFAGDGAGDIYVQKIDPAVNQPLLFDEGGFPVCSWEGNQCEPSIIGDGIDGVYLAWTDYRNDSEYSDLYGVHLLGDGFPASETWGIQGSVICDAAHDQSESIIKLGCADGSTGAIVAWVDKRASDIEEMRSLFIQRIAVEGEVHVEEKPHVSLLPALPQISAFPNPFNSRATITYSLPKPGRYALDVVDIRGRLIARLSYGWKEAGSYREVWEAGATPGGAYVIRLNSPAQSYQVPVIITK